MAGSSNSLPTEELLWATAGSVQTRIKTSSASGSASPPYFMRTTTINCYSHHLCISNQEKEKENQLFNFGPVPTKVEAEEALSSLQRLFFSVPHSQFFGDTESSTERDAIDRNRASSELVERVSSAELPSDRTISGRQLHQPKLLQSQGIAKVFEAFRLLVFNPLVQRMVVSLASDKAVWDAIMKNKVVQEIQESFRAESTKPQNSEGRDDDVGTIILRWILEITKAKIMELIDKFTKVVSELFHSQETEKDTSNFDHVVRSSFMISIMVIMIIIVARMK